MSPEESLAEFEEYGILRIFDEEADDDFQLSIICRQLKMPKQEKKVITSQKTQVDSRLATSGVLWLDTALAFYHLGNHSFYESSPLNTANHSPQTCTSPAAHHASQASPSAKLRQAGSTPHLAA